MVNPPKPAMRCMVEVTQTLCKWCLGQGHRYYFLILSNFPLPFSSEPKKNIIDIHLDRQYILAIKNHFNFRKPE